MCVCVCICILNRLCAPLFHWSYFSTLIVIKSFRISSVCVCVYEFERLFVYKQFLNLVP